MITTRAFWLGATERAIKTFFQTLVAVITLNLGSLAVGVDAGITNADWIGALSVSLLATALSLATSIGNANFTAGTEHTPAPAPQPEYVGEHRDEG